MNDNSKTKFPTVASLPFSLGKPLATAKIRTIPEDFQVDEELPFQPEGEGEHLFVHIRKRNTNTEWLAREIAKTAGIPTRDISYAGLKDRNAVTSQWLSLRIPGNQDPDLSSLESEDIQVLEQVRHKKKLRRGVIARNIFTLNLREVEGDRDELEQRLRQISVAGIPNYFGEQRFGHDGNNLRMAQRLFAGELNRLSRHKRGIYLSAARSFLFNQVLAQRVSDTSWDRVIAGDIMLLDGSSSRFSVLMSNAEIEQRLSSMDIHPSGPMYGQGDSGVTAATRELESRVLGQYHDWLNGLEGFGLDLERRPLRARVMDMTWEWLSGRELLVRFSLYPGSYATMLLRELFSYSGLE